MTIGSAAQAVPSKQFNLRMHTRPYIPSDVAMGSKEFRPGTLIEIRQMDTSIDQLWIVFEVGTCRDDIPKDVISLEQSIASQLQLRPHANISVRIANSAEHVIDLVELLIKDQYLSQADLWLLTANLRESCIHVGKLIEFQGMRSTVKLLWRQGESVASGYVSSDPRQTKVVFRSATTSVSIFILMTREMWQYDLAGDLCFQLVVSGLLTDLCSAWREQLCTHDMTFVMVTRVIYDAKRLEDFAGDVRPNVQLTATGQFCEDFYDVIVQNERFDDWSDTLMQLNKCFISMDERVRRTWRCDLPPSRIAYSPEGPVLESINMVLNGMDTHRFDHRFDRTGHAITLVAASQGVYDVDKRLKSITKRRVIESGLAVDLVCVLPQPFHPVPLFRMFDRRSSMSAKPGAGTMASPLAFEYALPTDWINASFYQPAYSTGSFGLGVDQGGDDVDSDDRRAVAVFGLSPSENFALPVIMAQVDMPAHAKASSSQKNLFNPFQPLSPPSLNTSATDKDRASRPHANRWLHALPQNELGEALQVHRSRNRSSRDGAARRRVGGGDSYSDVMTGVDWKSLILPAVLPTTAAAGPGLDAWLKEACVESPHDVFFNFPSSSPASAATTTTTSSKRPCGFRRPEQPQEALDVLVLLRLAAGFQLVLLPLQEQPNWNPMQSSMASSSSSSSTGTTSKLNEIFKIHRNPAVLMASGRYYQRLELIEADQRITVTKFIRTKRRAAQETTTAGDGQHQVFRYRFSFRVPDIAPFQPASTEFANRHPDLLNLWSALDYHVTSPTSEIDLSDDSITECFWKSCFTILPLVSLPSSSTLAKTATESASPPAIDWNKIVQDLPQAAAEFAALSRLVGYMNGFTASRSSTAQTTPTEATSADKHQVNMVAHLQTGLEAFGVVETQQQQQQASVRFFTTYDAVSWLLAPAQLATYGLETVEQCMAILNDMLDSGRIFSASAAPRLLYGIYYFSFVQPTSPNSRNLVEISFGSTENLQQAERSVLLNVDPSTKGSRRDLAMVVHDASFETSRALGLRLEWLMASGSFLCDLVDSWHHRARSFGLHLLPVPSNPFDMSASDPLRLIIDIPFEPPPVLASRASLVADSLLGHFAFSRRVPRSEDQHCFIHISGIAFVRRTPRAFEWAWNYQLSRRWQSIIENDAGDKLLANFRRLVSNTDDSLIQFAKQKRLLPPIDNESDDDDENNKLTESRHEDKVMVAGGRIDEQSVSSSSSSLSLSPKCSLVDN